jgi:hypothetical protein
VKILLIDVRQKDSNRAANLKGGLEDYGHRVSMVPQVDGSNVNEMIGPWSTFREAALTLVKQHDLVLLHVGEKQNHHFEFLRDCCIETPTLCFSGAPPAPRLTTHCRKSGIHVVYPRRLGQIAGSYVSEEIGRWVNEVGAANGDRRKIQRACEDLDKFDPVCEDAIELLSSILRGGEDARTAELAGRLKVSRSCTRENLTELRNHLFPEL